MDTEQRFVHKAMATTFEVVAPENKYNRQAAEAAFAEIDIIEKQLSRFIEYSDVSQINHLAAGQSTKIGFHTFECLKIASRACTDTGGAFDVTIGPLMKCWRNADGTLRQPPESELANARARVGMRLLELNDAERSVRVKKSGVQVDLGGIGKGYAVDRAAEILKEWDIDSVLINAADSTTLAIGHPAGKEGWKVGVGGSEKEIETPETITLCDSALSGSGIQAKGRHIMDPRKGRPVFDKSAAWALCPAAAFADALSTAFMVMSPEEVEEYCRKHTDTSAMLAMGSGNEVRLLRFGKW